MRLPSVKIDLFGLAVAAIFFGAGQIVGHDPDHQLEKWFFWAGVCALIFIAGWNCIAFLVDHLGRASTGTGSTNYTNQGGAYAGRDNTGTQQVINFNGPATFHQGAASSSVASMGMRLFKAADRVPIRHALVYGLNRIWPDEKYKLDTSQADLILQVLERMRGLAGEGRLEIWGRLTPGHLHTAISQDYWVTHQIEYLSVVFGDELADSKTEPTVSGVHEGTYYDLQLDRTQVQTLWPKW